MGESLTMKIMLATLALNEMEWLPHLFDQHREWDGLVRWVFVESADAVYAAANPDMVTTAGLSIDGTSEYLAQIQKEYPDLVSYVPHGFSTDPDPAQGKCESRNEYLKVSEDVKPDYVMVLDADEFYPYEAQRGVNKVIQDKSNRRKTGFCFRQRNVWHPPSVKDEPLFKYEVSGGFWAIPHFRCWRWYSGMRYDGNHNTPTVSGNRLDQAGLRLDIVNNTPECIHMGFASNVTNRHAKHRYYAERGEKVDPRRKWYVESRTAFETWKPGERLPRGAKVSLFDGAIPETFLREKNEDSI